MRIAVRFHTPTTAEAPLPTSDTAHTSGGAPEMERGSETAASAHTGQGEPAGPTVTDLHLRGAFVSSGSLPAVGETVNLTLDTAAQWAPVAVKAQVRWVREGDHRGPGGFGVEFLEVDDGAALALYRLLVANRYRA